MSDRLSPENLGKELYILQEINTEGKTRQAANTEWGTFPTHWKQEWETIASSFCKYLKEAEADS